MLAPPSGRPPTGPLKREDPQVYDVTFQVMITTLLQRDPTTRAAYVLKDAPIVMPIIYNSTFSKVDVNSLRGQLWLGSVEDPTVRERFRVDDGMPFNTHLAVMTVKEFQGQSLRFRVNFRTQVWDSKIDDVVAGAITWPKEWPEEVRDGLKPQMYIECDAAVFKSAVEDASKGQLRFVPPYYAAKDLVRYCLDKIRVSGDGVNYGNMEVILGLQMSGALDTVQRGTGGPHDLVCVCVATLRAAGIPSRPVVGFAFNQRTRRYELKSWGEFFLPDCGWIPFDPNMLRDHGYKHRKVQEAWTGFGNVDDLNERIPLAFHYIPPTQIETPINPAVWGWDPRPGGDPSSEQHIVISAEHRGAGKDEAE
jgi:hypothetical protein